MPYFSRKDIMHARQPTPEERFEFMLEELEGIWLRTSVLFEEGYVPTPEQDRRLKEFTRGVLQKVDL
jgi:hypothetical protein